MRRIRPLSSIDHSFEGKYQPIPSPGRKSLALCGLSVALSLILLIGVTFALFSDTIRNTDNRIQTGNMKIGCEVSDKLTGENDLDTSSPHYRNLKETDEGAIFSGDSSNWKPGDHGVTYLKIYNSGTMPLNYQMRFLTTDGGLGGALTFTITKLSKSGDIAGGNDGSACVSGETLQDVSLTHTDMAAGDEFDLYRLDYVLSESLDNTYNTDTPAYFSMDVELNAQQLSEGNAAAV